MMPMAFIACRILSGVDVSKARLYSVPGCLPLARVTAMAMVE